MTYPAVPTTFSAGTVVSSNFLNWLNRKATEVISVADYGSMQSAYNALSSSGGVVLIPPGYTETWSSDLTMSKPFSGFIFMGKATITMGNYKLVMTDGYPGQFIDTWSAISGGDFFAQVAQGVYFSYTNSSTNTVAMQIGQGTLQTGSTEDCFRLLRGFALNIESAGTGTIGIQLNNQLRMNVEGVNVKASGAGGSSMIGLQIKATGTGYCGWINIKDSFFSGGMVGVDVSGPCNLNTWQGGGCSTSTGAGTSWGIRRGTNSGSSFRAYNIELAGCTRAVQLASGVSYDYYENYGESNIYDVYFDSGASYNTYKNIASNTAPLVSDGNGASTTNLALSAGDSGGSNLYIAGNNNYLYGLTSSGNYRKLVGHGASTTVYHGDNVADITNHQHVINGGTESTLNSSGLKLAHGLGVYGNSPAAQSTGWGTPTGNVTVNNFPGATATLLQTSETLAQVLTILKSIGIIAT